MNAKINVITVKFPDKGHCSANILPSYGFYYFIIFPKALFIFSLSGREKGG